MMSLAAGFCYAQTAPGSGKDFAPRAGGIWKAAVPRVQMNGEFDSYDPVGVAAGARIKADCSINWISPDDGARYCFSSGTSLEFFLYSPQTSIERARAGWLKLKPRTPGGRIPPGSPPTAVEAPP